MLGMSKKKPEPASKKSRHKSPHLIRLPAAYYESLKAAAALSKRPLTWELQVALAKHLRDLGMEPPPEPGTST